MGIESKHPNYTKFEGKWARCRDTFRGEDDVKDKGEDYLPALKKQSNDSYKAYKMRSNYYNAVNRTVTGLVGAVMRIPPVIEGLNDDWIEDITSTGIGVKDFISGLLTEQLLMGRQGVLVDHNGERPYLTGYTTEQIVNWFEDQFVLSEQFRSINPDDPYESGYETQYRELLLDEGSYVVRIWRQGKDSEWSVVDEIQPSKRGIVLNEIPFIPMSLDGNNVEPEIPPLLSLVDMNLSHYRTSADLEHGRHFTALPTPYVTGVDTESELHIGAEAAWVLPDTASKAGYLEFSGQGLKALETAMADKRSMMASLGAQLLEGQKSGVEAAETVKIKQNSDHSVLSVVVQSVEDGINAALAKLVEWEGGGSPTVIINRDFSDVRLDPTEVTALMSAWQSGAISHETFLYNMKRGEIVPEGVSIEEERDRIDVQLGGVSDSINVE